MHCLTAEPEQYIARAAGRAANNRAQAAADLSPAKTAAKKQDGNVYSDFPQSGQAPWLLNSFPRRLATGLVSFATGAIPSASN